jgi:hypothetical protein
MNSQRLMNNIWNKRIQEMRSDDVKLIGNVIGKVTIGDLGMDIEYKKIVNITNADYQRSKDIRFAIQKGWLLMADRYNSNQQQHSITQQITTVEKETVTVKTNNMEELREMAQMMAKEMVKEIIKNMPTQTVQIQSNTPIENNKKLEAIHLDTDNYVDMKEEKDNTPSIDLTGIVDIKQVNTNKVNSALEKMKQLKKMKNNEGE